MKTQNYIILGSAVIIAALLVDQCEPSPRPRVITIPQTITLFDTVRVVKHVPINTENPLNKKLLKENEELRKKFSEATPEEKDSIYTEAIAVKDFSHTFEDEKSKSLVFGQVRGEVLNLALETTIKEQTIEVPAERWKVLGGLQVQSDLTKTQFIPNIAVDLGKTQIEVGRSFDGVYIVGVKRVIFKR